MNTQQHEIDQEEIDRLAVCTALRNTMKERNFTAVDLAAATGVPQSNILRMTRFQEPRVTFVAQAERIMGVRLGTIYRAAGLSDIEGDVVDLLETDPKLHAVFQREAPLVYANWVRLSEEFSD